MVVTSRVIGRVLVAMLSVAALAGLGWLCREEERSVAGHASPPADVAARSAPAAELAAPQPVPPPADELRGVELDSRRAPPESAALGGSAGADDLLVAVVDPAGAPRSGIRLRLERGTNEAGGASIPGPLATDERGRARFPGVRAVLAGAARPWTLQHELQFEEPPYLTLDRATLSASEVVSVLPWGGPLEVAVRELGGDSAPDGSRVRIRLLGEEDRLNPVPTGPEWKATLSAGTALFPWVELGRTWQVSAWRPEGSVPSSVRMPGPRVGGETVRTEIVLGADHPIASFRAVDAGGKPFVSVSLVLEGGRTTTRVTTDADGRFTLDGESTPFEGEPIVVTYREGTVLQGIARFPRASVVGWNDGGDVVLEAEPLLCAGRAVDERGNPVHGADVAAGINLDSPVRTSSSWQVRARSDEQGRFELRGLKQRDFDLRAVEGSRRSDKLRVRPGASDLELVLTSRYTVSGRLLVDEGVDPRSIRFQWKAPGADPFPAEIRRSPYVFAHPLQPNRQRIQDGSDGRFELAPVQAGEYALLCLLERVELARLENLSIRADLDLGDIDLGGRIHVCEIALLGAEDPAKLAGEYDWTPHGKDEHAGGGFDRGLVRIQTATVPIDVEVRPRGYRLARLVEVSGRRELVLEPPLRIRLVLQTDGELPEQPYLFRCQLRRGDVDVGMARGMRYFTKDSREIEMDVSTAGRLRVQWLLERRIDATSITGASWRGVLVDHEVDVEVLDVPGVQVLTLPLDGAALTALARDPRW